MTRSLDRPGARRSLIAQVLLLVVVLGGIAYLGDSVTDSGLFSGSRDVTLRLETGGGIHEGSNVTHRGSKIGTVRDVRLEGGEVVVRARLHGDVRIPVDTEVVVANLSPIGEQYLDFRPRSAGAPFLADGAVVGPENTRVPLRLDTLLVDVADVADLIDPDDIRTITREMRDAFDTEVELAELGSQANRALTTLEDLQPRIFALMDNARVPLRSIHASEQDLRTFAEQVDLLAAQLETSDPALRELVTRADRMVPQLDDLLRTVTADLDRMLPGALRLSRIASDRPEGLDHWLTWAPDQMVGMYESTRDGTGWTLLVPNPSRTCDYGSTHTSPFSTDRTAARTDARCTVVDPFVQQRGSQYAPGTTP